MSVTLLRTLIAVAETGSFVAASGRVHVSQAAVGQQMRKLEELIGAELFDRVARPPALTPLGLSLMPSAREAVAAYDAVMRHAAGDVDLTGSLTLGAVPSTLHGLVPMALKSLMDTTPQLQVRLVPGLSGDLTTQVERGTLDAALTSALPGPSKQFTSHEIAVEPLVLISSPDTPISTPAEMLRSLPYVRHTRRAAAGQIAEDWLAAHGIDVQSTMELESLETVASAVAHGLGVAIVPDICVPDATFRSLTKTPLNAPGRTLCLLSRADCPKALLIQRLVDVVQNAVQSAKDKL